MRSAEYTIIVVDNRLPLKKWTVTEVLDRLFDLAEPIREGEVPRFRLQGVIRNADGTRSYEAGSQAALFDTIPAPEFSFTKQNLRECLKQVGYIVHGEPRLTPKKDGTTGEWYYEVSYDLFGGTRVWRHAKRRYIADTVANTIAQYATTLDSNPENLVNKLKDYEGVTTEPYSTGYESVRTEEMYGQITESNMIIETKRPIYTVEKIEFNWNGTAVDLTPYVFEESVYNSQLSAYDSTYPYSKAFGLMYKQGERNITALNFKQEHAISEIFEDYSIVNIVRRATGDDSFNPKSENDDYAKLSFRVTYTPIYNARVKQTKTNYREYEYPAAMFYNQSSNLVESRAFGEDQKGTIARLGNPEISRTYMFSRLSQIPQAGMKFDDDYYISAVFTEILPTYIRSTVALTRDFNRISQYIGIPQVKRYSQISQTMALDRNIVYEEYLVIGDNIESDEDSIITTDFLYGIRNAFMQDNSYPSDYTPGRVSCVVAWGGSYGNSSGGYNAVELPVVTSAYGNSIVFSWEYRDNYSAGTVSTFRSNGRTDGEEVKGYFQSDYPYADYYGRMYYYTFALNSVGHSGAFDTPMVDQYHIPYDGTGAVITNAGQEPLSARKPFVIRKDSRERLQVNVQIHLVTNRKGLIIGSALASYSGSVRSGNAGLAAKLYVLDRELDKFADHLEAQGLDLSQYEKEHPESVVGIQVMEWVPERDPYNPMQKGLVVEIEGGGKFPASGVAWVIATGQAELNEETVVNERGETSVARRTIGGDLLLGQNMKISAGDDFTPIYFTRKRKIYRGTVWKDKI